MMADAIIHLALHIQDAKRGPLIQELGPGVDVRRRREPGPMRRRHTLPIAREIHM